MSIYKKTLLYMVTLVIIPMLILLVVSSYILKYQVEKSAESYLQNSLKIAKLRIDDRLNEMKLANKALSLNKEFKRNIITNNKKALNMQLEKIHSIYNYLDIICFLDNKKKSLINYPNSLMLKETNLQNILLTVDEKNETLNSLEVFKLDKLFLKNSKEYKKFKVGIINFQENLFENFNKCLACIVVSPVLNEDGKTIGYIIYGDIINNDNYFPDIYSKSVENSYLAISVDGIRITSNIESPRSTNYIGSFIPISMNTLKINKNSYYGRINIDNEIHVFIDELLTNCNNHTIGALGVGIPEKRFSILVDTNQKFILLVSILCFIAILFIGKYIALKIVKPIEQATIFTEQIVKGKREFDIDNNILKDESETSVLLKSIQKMASDLTKSEIIRKNYLQRLIKKHKKEKQLTGQLKMVNNELEEKVAARTIELQQVINALKKADKVKSQFLANMSHELRTPLSAIICSSDVLVEGIFGDLKDKQKKYVQNIFCNSKHLLQLINDILDISKIEAGKMNLNLDKYAIRDLILNSIETVRSLAYRKNINITIKINPSNFYIVADGQKIKQILYNLLSNSIKFTSQNGEVFVGAFLNDDVDVYFRVKDNGIGIKKENQLRVFEEFEQVDSSYSREYEGTGLGLPLTKKLVEMHGGDIYLNSKEGIGTEIIFTIPIEASS